MGEEEYSQEIVGEQQSILNAMKSMVAMEIILFAMYAIQRDPNTSIPDAIQYGFDEWER